MKIYESAVRKPVSTVLMFVGVMVFGLFSLMNLAVDQYPEIEIPQIFLPVVFDGFSWRQHDVLVEAMGVSVFFKGRRLGRVSEPKARSPRIEMNLVLLIVQQKYYPHVW